MSENKNQSSISVDGVEEKKLKVPTGTFEADGKEYKFNVAQFIYEGEVVRASEALKNAILLAKLVSMKAGVIELVQPEEIEAEGGE